MKVQHNVPLAGYTSLHAGGPAQVLVEPDQNDTLKDMIENAQRPVWVLGFGTNILVSDKGLDGTVIINHSGRIDVLDNGQIKAGSGANWDELIQTAISHNLWGLEFTSGVPGGVGAAIAGNIAAYGHKIADCFTEATMLNTNDGSVHIWHNDDFGFDYRTSNLQKTQNSHWVILDALFQFQDSPTGNLEYESALKTAGILGIKPDTLQNRRAIIIETRRLAGSLLQDTKVGPWTAGSFFKNPVVDENQIEAILSHEESPITKDQLLRQNLIHSGNTARISAAHVLLAAGFHRGQTWNQVRLHPNHILKIENIGNATAQEIYDVVQQIIQTVQEKLNIRLEPEVRFIGEF